MRGAEEPYSSRSRHPRRKDLVTGTRDVRRTPHSGNVRGTLRRAQRGKSGHSFTIAGTVGKASRALCGKDCGAGRSRIAPPVPWREPLPRTPEAFKCSTPSSTSGKSIGATGERLPLYNPDMNESQTQDPSDPKEEEESTAVPEKQLHRWAGEGGALPPPADQAPRSADDQEELPS